jgi:hypothetical protein
LICDSAVFQRFRRLAKKGVWQIIFNTLAVSDDTKWLMIDSTIIRAHQHSAGALKKTVSKKVRRQGEVVVDLPPKFTLLATTKASLCGLF